MMLKSQVKWYVNIYPLKVTKVIDHISENC